MVQIKSANLMPLKFRDVKYFTIDRKAIKLKVGFFPPSSHNGIPPLPNRRTFPGTIHLLTNGNTMVAAARQRQIRRLIRHVESNFDRR
jgi:hypothetical protein